MRRTVFLSVLAVCFFSATLQALTIAPLSPEEMIAGSKAIVEGRVASVRTDIAAGNPRRVAVLEVTQVHKGSVAAGTQIEVSYPGGPVGDLVLAVPGTPSLAQEDQLFLFLHSLEGGKGRVLGYNQGCYGIFGTGRSAVARRKVPITAPGVAALAAPGRKPFPDEVTLDDLRRFVHDAQTAPGKAIPPAPLRTGNPPRPAAGLTAPLPNAAAAGANPVPFLLPVALFFSVLVLLAAAILILRLPSRRLALAAAAILAACVSAASYERLRVPPNGPYIYWWASDMPVNWFMNADSTSDCLHELVAIQKSFNTWEDVPTATIAFYYAGPLPFNPNQPGNPYIGYRLDYKCCVWWDNENRSGEFSAGILGLTWYWYNPSTGQMADADITFNDQNYSWNAQGQGGTMPVEGVATHEIGHLLGLGHSAVPEATMYAYYHPGAETLAQDDIDGVTAIYPDTTPPPPPVITTNGGANFTTPDALLTLQGTMSSDTYTIEVNASTTGVAPFSPGDTNWSYSTTLTLPGQIYTFSVVAKDATGNASAPDTISVTFNPVKPVVDEFYLFDFTTASQTITDWPFVGVRIHAFDQQTSVAYYLLSENGALNPDAAMMASLGETSAPLKFELSNTQGAHTVYAWVMDTDDNIAGPYSAAITLDTVSPFVTGVSAPTRASVVIEFSEDMLGVSSPSAYTVLPAASVSAVTALSGRKYVLRTQQMAASTAYTVTVSPQATDATGENKLYPPGQAYSFTTPSQAQATVGAITEKTHEETIVRYTAEVSNATNPANYRVGASSFVGTEVFEPEYCEWLGGASYLLKHFDLFQAIIDSGYTWPDDFPFDTYLAARNIYDKSGAPIERNYPPGSPSYYVGILAVNEPPVTDTASPYINLFTLRAMTTRSAVTTEARTVAVEIDASDDDTGIIRWYLTEDPTPPTVNQILAGGAWTKPVVFTLNATLGLHTVYLHVVDAAGNTASASASITLVADAVPAVSAAASPTFEDVPPAALIDFTSAGTADPEGALVGIIWDFDDGGHSTDADPAHSYNAACNYTVTLYAKDAWGNVGKDTVDVTIVTDADPPTISVSNFTLHGRVDAPAVAVVNVDGVDFPVTTGDFAPFLALPSGGKTYTISVDDGINPPHVSTLEVTVP